MGGGRGEIIWETGEKEVGVESEVGGFKDLLEVGKR